ncbi:MAG: hypothetical protein FJ138_10390 [Deltaproteobacteria bacterium]|nr:hypothetical protein [Deltaproteobacteria bacterium]
MERARALLRAPPLAPPAPRRRGRGAGRSRRRCGRGRRGRGRSRGGARGRRHALWCESSLVRGVEGALLHA